MWYAMGPNNVEARNEGERRLKAHSHKKKNNTSKAYRRSRTHLKYKVVCNGSKQCKGEVWSRKKRDQPNKIKCGKIYRAHILQYWTQSKVNCFKTGGDTADWLATPEHTPSTFIHDSITQRPSPSF